MKTEYHPSEDVSAKLVITPGNPRPSKVDSDVFHAAYSHAHETPFIATARTLAATLTTTFRTHEGCAVSRGFHPPIPSKTECWSNKMLGRVFVDLSGSKEVAAFGKNRYVSFFCDDFSRFMWLYFLVHKDYVA